LVDAKTLSENMIENLDLALSLTIDEINDLFDEFHSIVKTQSVCKTISSGSALAVGDIHGDFEILKSVVTLFLVKDKINHLIFLGDIVDRGSNSIACTNLILSLIIKFPKKVHFIRGNHETLSVNSRYGFQEDIQRYGFSLEMYQHINMIFSQLPLALVHEGFRYFFVHGGIPVKSITIDEFNKLPKAFDLMENNTVMQILWNDPKEGIGRSSYSMRGTGIYTYGKERVDEFLKNNNLKMIIRAHEAFPEGSKYFFDNKLLSIFTSEEYYTYTHAKVAYIDKKGKITIFHPSEMDTI